MSVKVYAKTALSISVVTFLILFLSSCTQMPLKADNVYPADWPKLTTVSKGAAEINGTYANQGVAVQPDGSITRITLDTLIPRPGISRIVTPEDNSSDNTVALTLLPRKGWLGVPHINAHIKNKSADESYEFEIASDENAILYLLTLKSDDLYMLGLSTNQARVFLTVGEDGSLIAKIHKETFKQFMLYMDYSSEYIWARFERIQ